MQFYDVSQTSLAKSGSSVVEEYIPLWMADGTSVGGANTTPNLIIDGGNGSMALTNITSATKLFTLNSSWSPTQKYAFEATIFMQSGGTGLTAYACLYDLTSGTASQISGSIISNANVNVATVVRSAQFSLTPGHVYGVGIYSNGSYGTYISDASLIIFGQ